MSAFEQFNCVGLSRYGKLVYNQQDEFLRRSIELYGEYREREAAVFDQIIQPGQVVLEIGANVGAQTLFFAHRVGPQGRVLAFEPRRLSFQALCGSLSLNSITNVHCWNMAVGAEAGETTIPSKPVTQPGAPSNAAAANDDLGYPPEDEPKSDETVAVVDLDSLNLPRLDFIKLDSSTAEDVLRGAANSITRHKPIVYVTSCGGEKEIPLIRRIAASGYAMFWHDAPLFNSDNFAGNSSNVFGDQTARNLLCIDKAADRQLTGFTQVDVPTAA